VRKYIVVLGAVFAMVTAAPALAAPTPNPVAPQHTTTACQKVIANNPNAAPGGHISDQGAANFGAVGGAFCGL
jgi:hypothetical protein